MIPFMKKKERNALQTWHHIICSLVYTEARYKPASLVFRHYRYKNYTKIQIIHDTLFTLTYHRFRIITNIIIYHYTDTSQA